jgi:hypothetical protein
MTVTTNHSLALDALAAATTWSYRASHQSATEPAAWAALALAAHDRMDAAQRAAKWLATLQQPHGSIGVSKNETSPCWPTSLAMLAWCALERSGGHGFKSKIARAAAWALSARGKATPRSPHIGHNTELVGWSWAAETHSWLEPTCLFVMGLRAAGYGHHARVREGLRLIVDRLLPDGGANYGNTVVLGQPLVPHIQPTGLAMLALAGEPVVNPRVQLSLRYLETSIGPDTSASSLATACLGLAAHGKRPSEAESWLDAALTGSKNTIATYEQALLLLARAPLDALGRIGLLRTEAAS